MFLCPLNAYQLLLRLFTIEKVRPSSPKGSCESVTFTTNCSPFFMVTVKLSSVSKGSMLIIAQSPVFTVCALISAICSSVNSALYWHSNPLISLSLPTVLSASTFLTHTSSGFEKSTLSTSATNFLVSSDTTTSSSVSSAPSELFSSVSDALFSISLVSFSEEFVSPVIPSTSTSCSNEINPPPGILNSYVLPSTSQWKSTV